MTTLNYFVCTLGQATLLDSGKPFRNIIQLLDGQAEVHAESPAVGFPIPLDINVGEWQYEIFSFKELRKGSLLAAERLTDVLPLPSKATVGLICGSSVEFLFTLLGCIQLGHPVLLVAPQCSATAIAHLCKSCDITILLCDASHHDAAELAVTAGRDLQIEFRTQLLPYHTRNSVYELFRGGAESSSSQIQVDNTHVAYLHHTSGTSSGIPKPIPQSHRAAVGVLPCLEGSEKATFSTTPLYHGGVADMFRAWTSSALIWLFPEKQVPITAKNVLKCLNTTFEASKSTMIPPVKYFSSVPYVLQQLAESNEGLSRLQSMDLVGVGGAALPKEAGDVLVRHGINLVSRYGSVENGFLMSSQRDFDTDQDWQYLRKDSAVSQLTFEEKGDGLSELVVRPGWPHIAKTNREDGSYATSDLFAPHPDITNAWRYHSRADSQIALITGKKFDPAPIEDALKASTALVDDVLIFGEGRAYPGALMFRSRQALESSEQQILDALAIVVQNLNHQNPSHARLQQNMIHIMPYSHETLPKSSKGTILRGEAQETYRGVIEKAYEGSSSTNGKIADNDIQAEVLKLILQASPDGSESILSADTDLFAYGIDSLASIQVRNSLNHMLPNTASPLPLTIVQDVGTVSKLTDMILRRRHGIEENLMEEQKDLVPKYVEQFSQFRFPNEETAQRIEDRPKSRSGRTVLLTGPTGFLGAHVLSLLLQQADTSHIYLLLRGATAHAARERVIKALNARLLPIPSDFNSKVTILTGKLHEIHLGLSHSEYRTLAREVDLILHLAWSVNFLLPLRSFAQHLAGVQNIVELVLTSARPDPPQFVFCSSAAAVVGNGIVAGPVREAITQVQACGPTGYAQSKFTAELICAEAAKLDKMKNKITVIRVGQLSGDTIHGIWNHSEAYPLMLSTAKVSGCLPDLGNEERLTWLPVDVAAQCFLEATINTDNLHSDCDVKESIRVLHLGNFTSRTTFKDLTRILLEQNDFDIVTVEDWLSRVSKIDDKNHPAIRLLPFWKTVYLEGKPSDNEHLSGTPERKSEVKSTPYLLTQSCVAMPTLQAHLRDLASAYILQLWGWVKTNSV